MKWLSEKLQSKKLRVTIVACIVAACSNYFQVDGATTEKIVGALIAYIIGQGIADHGKEAEKEKKK